MEELDCIPSTIRVRTLNLERLLVVGRDLQWLAEEPFVQKLGE